jgi:SAM-dependent methyltransferase
MQEIDADSPLNKIKALHRETGAGWDIVAKTGYMGEIEPDIEFIRRGGCSLMAPELALLTDLKAWCRRAVHLQCSGGRDALSLWNLGAHEIIGVDISEILIGYARQKSDALGAPATWYCCDILDTPNLLDGTVDLIYTGRGALPWIMDLTPWAALIHRLLRPNGQVFVFEGHPLDALWDTEAAALQFGPQNAGYFDTRPLASVGFPGSVVTRETGGAADRPRMRERQWRPGEVMNSLVGCGFRLMHFDEYPELFWDQFPSLPKEIAERLPHTYSLLMRKSS